MIKTPAGNELYVMGDELRSRSAQGEKICLTGLPEGVSAVGVGCKPAVRIAFRVIRRLLLLPPVAAPQATPYRAYWRLKGELYSTNLDGRDFMREDEPQRVRMVS